MCYEYPCVWCRFPNTSEWPPQELMHTLPKAKLFFLPYGKAIVTCCLLFGYKSTEVSEGAYSLAWATEQPEASANTGSSMKGLLGALASQMLVLKHFDSSITSMLATDVQKYAYYFRHFMRYHKLPKLFLYSTVLSFVKYVGCLRDTIYQDSVHLCNYITKNCLRFNIYPVNVEYMVSC
jgi:hypothetical protein